MLLSLKKTEAASANIQVWIRFEKEDGTHFEHEAKLRLIYEDEEGRASARGLEKGEWKLLQHSLSKIEWSDIKTPKET